MADRISGGLLAFAAALILVASILPLEVWSYRQTSPPFWMRLRRTAWQLEAGGGDFGTFHSSDTYAQFSGIALAVCGVAAVVVGTLLFFGAKRWIGLVRMLGCLTAGMTFGVALTLIVSWMPSHTGTVPGEERSFTAGFWALVLTAVVSVAALITGLVAHRGSTAEDGRTGDVVVGALLIIAAVPTVAGSFLTIIDDGTYEFAAWWYTGEDETSMHWNGAPLALCAAAAVMAAVLLFFGLGARIRPVRGLAAFATGLILATTLTTVLVAMSQRLGDERGVLDYAHYVAGFWTLVAAVVLSFAAMATAISNFRR